MEEISPVCAGEEDTTRSFASSKEKTELQQTLNVVLQIMSLELNSCHEKRLCLSQAAVTRQSFLSSLGLASIPIFLQCFTALGFAHGDNLPGSLAVGLGYVFLGKFSQMKIIKQETSLHETTEMVAQASRKT